MDIGASLSTRISAGITTAVVLMCLAGCDVVTDAATRMADDIKAGANRLGNQDGATPTTHLLDKEAGSALIIDLERRSGRAIVTDVR